ncbi:hypothetical protein [Pseudomonas putida]|uniref:LexA repressor DNA-binding domain-containing protein n=1 Tax=Pseudomonas putida TaxID=303 RepID=A0A8I1EHC2_PSEPU|nr:hypothetical protein [Pseudomonas putida]MBI6885178.1 hypothetical protein [Pseudomonas putida]
MKPTTPLTEAQQQAYDFLCAFQDANGFPPTMKELAEGLQYRSANAAHEVMKRLEIKGVVKRDRNQARSIQIVGLQAEGVVKADNTPGHMLTLLELAVSSRNPRRGHACILGNAEKFADSLLSQAIPFSKNAQFLFRNFTFIEGHFQKLYAKVEGLSSARQKCDAAISVLIKTFMPSAEIAESLNRDIDVATGKTFQSQFRILRFFDALAHLFEGDSELYLEFLRTHPAIRASM